MSNVRNLTNELRLRQQGALGTSGEPPYDGGMEARVAKIESDLTAIKVDLAVIKSNGATKADVSDARTAIAEAKTSIILWVVSAIFLAQLLPAILKKLGI